MHSRTEIDMAVFEAPLYVAEASFSRESKVGSNVLEWYPHLMREKNGGKTKIAVRAVKAYISKSILPIAWTVTYIYICTGPADARPAWPDLQTHGRTDTQKHGRTRRRADGHAEAWTQTHTHGRRRKRPDAKYLCVQCAGGKIVQTQDASGRTHKDLRGVL